MQSAKALINLEVLAWARKSSGYSISEAATKLSKDPDIIEAWESGEKELTFKQLLSLANIYKRPVALFYLPKPPTDFKPLHDYRRLPGNIMIQPSPRLNYEIRKAYSRRQIAIELLEANNDINALTFDKNIKITENPETIGKTIRSWLGVEVSTQIKWRTTDIAFSAWRNAIEKLNILVFQAEKVDPIEMRGFAIAERPLPVVVVNKKDSHAGRIFSLIHELSHIFLGESSISGDHNEELLPPQDNKTEIFCNAVAAATLLPKECFKNDEVIRKYIADNNWDDNAVQIVADRFSVSREVVWRRLTSLNIISNQLYHQKRTELNNQFIKSSGENVIVPHHRKVLSSIGTYYARVVLSSYYNDKITTSDLSEYLGTKLKHIPEIEKSVFKDRD